MLLSRTAAALLITVAGLTGCVTFDHGEPDLPGTAAAIQSPGGEQAPPPTLTADRFIAADGVALPLRVWLPEGEPQAVVLALHALNDYSNAFSLPAPGLTAHGIAVY